ERRLHEMLVAPERALVLTSPSAETLVPGVARGVTLGGCASLLAAEIGSPTARPGAAGGILLLEDFDEDLYRLDRIFTQLVRSGWLDGAAGIAPGSWHGGEPGAYAPVLDRSSAIAAPIAGYVG